MLGAHHIRSFEMPYGQVLVVVGVAVVVVVVVDVAVVIAQASRLQAWCAGGTATGHCGRVLHIHHRDRPVHLHR